MTGLTPDQIQKLLFKPAVQSKQSPNNIKGPLKYYDNGLRCASRGCSSPTHYKVEGIARCMTHALNALNELVVEMDEIIKVRG